MARGRPRSFDTEMALDRALHIFWSKGYEGASLADLTDAMGVNPPSLYAAFGNKQALFRKALDRYVQRWTVHSEEALAAPTARAAAEAWLRGAADFLSTPGNPSGCLLVQAALVCSDGAAEVRMELAARRAAGEAAIRRRFEQAQAEGELPTGADPADLARYVASVAEGMAVHAAAGITRAELHRTVDIALQALPRLS